MEFWESTNRRENGEEALLERVVSVESHLNRQDLLEVSDFLKSDVISVPEKASS
jgi:hypothetical protein